MCPKHDFHEFPIQILYIILVGFENDFMDKASFLKKAKQRRPLYSCSRIRVGEVSPREEGTNNFKEILQKTFKDRTRKRGATNMINT